MSEPELSAPPSTEVPGPRPQFQHFVTTYSTYLSSFVIGAAKEAWGKLIDAIRTSRADVWRGTYVHHRQAADRQRSSPSTALKGTNFCGAADAKEAGALPVDE